MIPALNTTNKTNSHPEPHPHLPLGVEIAVAVVAAALICVTLIAILMHRNRRHKLTKQISILEKLAKFPRITETDLGLDSNRIGNLEIDGRQRPTPELDSVLQIEVDAGVAAHEVVDEATAVHEMP